MGAKAADNDMIAEARKAERRNQAPARWPELMKLSTAARMLDMDPSTFRPIADVLAAFEGLRIQDLCGRKVRRDELLAVLERLRRRGQAVRFDRASRIVWIGDQPHPAGAGSQRKGFCHDTSGKGRPQMD